MGIIHLDLPMRILLFVIILGLQLFLLQPLKAQSTSTATAPTDSLRLTLPQAEQFFQERNIPLLAQKAAIEASRLAIIQANLFENPILSIDHGIYNPINGHYFDLSQQGQTYVQLDQLFYLARKRNKRVQVEQLNTQLTEQTYLDLLCTLRFELRTSFIELHYKLQDYQVLQERTQAVQRLVTALDEQYRKGNIPLKEITRLKALLFQLGNQQLELLNEIQEEQAELSLLTRTPATTVLVPVVDEGILDNLNGNNLSYALLLETAQENRYDLNAAETDVQLQQANLKLQKALAVPDLSVGANYNRQSNFIRDYVGLNLSMPLPLWNRNQGNINMARHEIDRSQQLLSQQQLVVENEVMQAFQKAQEAQKFYASFDPNFR